MSKEKPIFLVAQYSMKPRDHVNTSVKGWMENTDNIRWDEQVAVTRGLKSRDMNAQVVLDLSNKKIERNTFNTDKSFDDVFRYFFVNYNQYVTEVMRQLDPEYLTQLVDLMEKELEEEEVAEAKINDEKVQAE